MAITLKTYILNILCYILDILCYILCFLFKSILASLAITMFAIYVDTMVIQVIKDHNAAIMREHLISMNNIDHFINIINNTINDMNNTRNSLHQHH